MSDTIDQVIAWLNKLNGAPAVALVFLSCIVLGYILRFIKRFPNDGIPVAVVLWGGIVMSIIADTRPSNQSLRVWIVRNVLVGMGIGFFAWLAHKLLISKIEDWIGNMFPSLSGTTFFRRKPTDNSEPPAMQEPTTKGNP